MAERLQLHSGKNRDGEESTVSRQTIKRLISSLISKGILTKKKVISEGHEVMQYILVSAKGELFTKIEKPLLEVLTRTLKGQVIKTYTYIKAIYEMALRNNNQLNLSRETIAKAINEVNKNGDIGERQLKNISVYLTLLNDLNLVETSVLIRSNIDGSYSKLININKVNSSLKYCEAFEDYHKAG